MTPEAFTAEYLVDTDPVEDYPYHLKDKPCAFLGTDGRCKIVSCQPAVCKGFPYTDQPDRFWSLYSTISHAAICPVVFEILERLKAEYRFPRWQRR